MLQKQARESSPASGGAWLARCNGFLEMYISCLQWKGYHTRCESAVPTVAGMWYPDICWNVSSSYVIDVQDVADVAAGSLDETHRRKVRYYDVPDILSLCMGSIWKPSYIHILHDELEVFPRPPFHEHLDQPRAVKIGPQADDSPGYRRWCEDLPSKKADFWGESGAWEMGRTPGCI